MAQRDTTDFRTVIQKVNENPSGIMNAVAEIGSEIIRQGEEAKINENLSKAQLDLNKLQFDYQTAYESDPLKGVDEYKEKRSEIFQKYGSEISPFYERYWNENTRKIEQTNDATQQGWALKQTRINTVKAINTSMKNSYQQANLDGQKFGASDDTEIGAYVNFETSKQNLAAWGNRNVGETTTAGILDGYDKDYMKSFISGVADKNPKKAAALLEDDGVKKMFTSDEIDTFENVIKKNAKRNELGSLFQQMDNEDKVTDIVNDPEGDYFSKRLQVDTLEFENKISPTAADNARRVLTSKKNVDSVTHPEKMSDIVQSMYDLNSIADMSQEDYLKGVANVRNDILTAQANGDLTPQDVQKLNGQLRTLTGAKVAGATQSVGMGFIDANKRFEMLPPQYRGKATRELFYATEGQEMTPDQINEKANGIIDNINSGIRNDTVQRLKKLQTPDEDFLKTKGYSMDDVKETAAKYNMTEQEVIKRLKAQ
jgi:hypothetical protein